ncbi:MAG: Fur family transcriptional regulator [Candidatus Cryptobacteroides sp.]
MNKMSHTAPTVDELKVILKKHGLKATQQRIAVHLAMLNLGHASADMVAEETAKEKVANVTAASVYNILSQMADIGVYSRRLSSNSKMYFDVNTDRHIHLYDSVNNTYRDLPDEGLLDIVQSYLGRKRFRGYKVEGIDVQIVCRPSRTKQ